MGTYSGREMLFSNYGNIAPADLSTFEEYVGSINNYAFTVWVQPSAAPFFQFTDLPYTKSG